MRILHVSDWHGNIWPEITEDYDVVVSSGDMMSNCSRGDIEKEKYYQKYWVLKNLDRFRNLIGIRPFLHTPGNHDFADLVQILEERNFEAYDLSESAVTIGGVKFLGFPYIPYIAGEWNYELMSSDLAVETHKLQEKLPHVDVFVPHCPPHYCLDNGDEGKFGNNYLTSLLHYGLEEEECPKWILCGHFHLSNGTMSFGSSKVSNAACGWRIVEV